MIEIDEHGVGFVISRLFYFGFVMEIILLSGSQTNDSTQTFEVIQLIIVQMENEKM
jgi:hypothetical protein